MKTSFMCRNSERGSENDFAEGLIWCECAYGDTTCLKLLFSGQVLFSSGFSIVCPTVVQSLKLEMLLKHILCQAFVASAHPTDRCLLFYSLLKLILCTLLAFILCGAQSLLQL